MSSSWDLPHVHAVDLTVSDEAIDVLGHANNVAYLGWLEKAAWAHTTALGLGWDSFQRLNRAMVARHTEMDYIAAAFAGDELRVGTWIVDNDGRISITRRYQIVRPGDGVTLMRARTRWVCVALDSGKPRRMPREFLQGYAVTAREGRD
jgi:acyl-CoA thioester hydrolase